jgi:hypothetical protein
VLIQDDAARAAVGVGSKPIPASPSPKLNPDTVILVVVDLAALYGAAIDITGASNVTELKYVPVSALTVTKVEIPEPEPPSVAHSMNVGDVQDTDEHRLKPSCALGVRSDGPKLRPSKVNGLFDVETVFTVPYSVMAGASKLISTADVPTSVPTWTLNI